MEKINAVITGVGGYVPDYILTNDEISKNGRYYRRMDYGAYWY